MEPLAPRSYQLEMLDMSLKENVIVVAFEGSASMRIMAELKRCRSGQLVWFLAPTKVLCAQQYQCISSHLPAIRTKLLTGDDGVDKWGRRDIWEFALHETQVVVSTHAVLADALKHSFVKFERLALIVFDEAHHCMKAHPGNMIMRDFYHPSRIDQENKPLPSILGLTASADTKVMNVLEKNLNAMCRAPHHHQEDLASFAPRRNIKKLFFSGSEYAHELAADFQTSLFISTDCHLSEASGMAEKARHELLKLYRKIHMIANHLGSWAARKYMEGIMQCYENDPTGSQMEFLTWGPRKWRKELQNILVDKIDVTSWYTQQDELSDKVERLLSYLENYNTTTLSGIIFVKERTTAFALSLLLDEHPRTSGRFRCAPCVSDINRSDPCGIHDHLEFGKCEAIVDQFRRGEKNLIIATNVLEEGVDLPACHLVLSFDPPESLQSYIQRRGRARHNTSEFVIMEEVGLSSKQSDRWRELEKEMQRLCSDPERSIDQGDERRDVSDNISLRLESKIGAVLTAESALSHLHHFCSTIHQRPHAGNWPVFHIETENSGRYQATVYLPSSIHNSLQVMRGQQWWKTKRAATQDAAFHAYASLHKAKLVNDHFLPLSHDPSWSHDVGATELITGPVIVDDPLNVWKELTLETSGSKFYRSRISIEGNGVLQDGSVMALFTKAPVPLLEPLCLYWDHETTFTVTVGTSSLEEAGMPVTQNDLCTLRRITTLLLQSTRTKVTNPEQTKHQGLVAPDIPIGEMENWLRANSGSREASSEYVKDPNCLPIGFIRSPILHNVPYIFDQWVSQPDTEEVILECHRFPNRRNLLEKIKLADLPLTTKKKYQKLSGPKKSARVSLETCRVDALGWKLARASLCIRPILQQVSRFFVARSMQRALFAHMRELKLSVLAESITAPCTSWPNNYQRLEFLGDCVLKFAACAHLFSAHPLWPEGYLTRRKGLIISNARLRRAAIDLRLDRFIWTEKGAIRHQSVEGDRDNPEDQILAPKTLADVVESLIGAAYVCGELAIAWRMLNVFLPEIPPLMPTMEFSPTVEPTFSESHEERLDRLLGYTFQNRMLLWDALTHPSWQRDSSATSYQRLEFLGDAVLDFLLARRLYMHKPLLSEGQMTQIRAALVNADFLAFLCMEFVLPETTHEVKQNGREKSEKTIYTPLWAFMRHDAPQIVQSQQACIDAHLAFRDNIINSFTAGGAYPWSSLSKLGADKFFSDIIESLLGAILVDNQCRLDVCEAFVKRIGITTYLERILENKIKIEHPKVALERITGSDRPLCSYDQSGSGRWSLSLSLSDGQVISAANCRSKEDAMLQCTDSALSYLASQEGKYVSRS